ncbi:hypothetical protein ACMV8I_08795 [Ewingella sp. S1.OA.A_B6]
MSQILIGDIHSALKNFGTYLDNEIEHFKNGMVEYWEAKGSLKSCLDIYINEDNSLYFSIPKLKFSCHTRDRFVFFGKTLIAEIEFFFTEKNKDIVVLRCFITSTGILTFDAPDSEEGHDASYDQNLELKVVNKLISSASASGLISVNA